MANRDKRWALAACTVAMAAAVGGPANAAAEANAVQSISSYCQTSWRNAGIRRQEWSDCTQQAVTELIERISTDRLAVAVKDNESSERRELNRAVWRIIQRWRRSPHLAPYNDTSTHRRSADKTDWNEVEVAASQFLSTRQLKILKMLRDGWRVHEIADDLNLSAARVSDEKYKAVKKLQRELS